MAWMARRVSASMSRRVWAIMSSRLTRASARISPSADSAVRRARATISSACPRASESRSRYSASSASASRRVRSAASMESSMAFWRLSSASVIRGNTARLSTKNTRPKMTSVQTIRPTFGLTRKLSAASTSMALEEEGDQARHEPVEEARLGERKAEPLDGGDLVAHLRLAGDGLDDLAEDDADAHAGAHGAEAAADAQGDGLARVRAVFRRGEDGGQHSGQEAHSRTPPSATRRPSRRDRWQTGWRR